MYRRVRDGWSTASYAADVPLVVPSDDWVESRWWRLGGERVLDLETGALRAVPVGARVLTQTRGRLLFATDDGLGVASAQETVMVPRVLGGLSGTVPRGAAGAFVLIGTGIVDVLTARYGVTDGFPWLVDRSGFVLVTTERAPLAWEPIHFGERSR